MQNPSKVKIDNKVKYYFKYDQLMVDKLHKMSRIACGQILGGESSRRVLYFAEEAVSEVLLSFAKKPPKNLINDGLLFITVKNRIISLISKENNTLKRVVNRDTNNLVLDEVYDGDVTLEIPDKDTTLTEKQLREQEKEYISGRLELINKIIRESPYIDDKDVRIFTLHFIDNLNIKEIGQVIKLSTTRVSQRLAKVKKIIRKVYETNDFSYAI